MQTNINTRFVETFKTKMMETKFTKGEWIADLRGGCLAVYPKHLEHETNGCHRDDKRNIFYSSKGAWYDENKGYWNMPEEERANAKLIASAPFQYDKHNENILLCDKVLEYALSGDNIKMIETLSKIKSNSIDSIKKATK